MPATRLPNPNLVFIGGQGIIMDYPCAKFGDFSFSCFDFIMRTDRQTDRITEEFQLLLTRLPST